MATLKRDGTCCICNQRMAAGTRIKWQRINGMFKPSHFDTCNSNTSDDTGDNMSTTEQLEASIGIRGDVKVTSSPDGGNRPLVRKWLSSRGIMASSAVKLTLSQLACVYNDCTDDTLMRLRLGTWPQKDDTSVTSDDSETQATVTSVTSTSKDDASALEMLRRLLGNTVDETKVQAIVDSTIRNTFKNLADELRESVQVTRIELKAQDGSVTQIEGHCHPKLATLIKCASSRQANGRHPNILLCGPTGSGKTHAAEQLAKALGLEFYTNGAISMDHQLIGFKDAAGNYHETALRKAFARPAVYLFDELDSSDNSALLCLAGALANGGFEFPDQFIERHPDSIIIAAGNTWGNGATADFVGRNKLDGAIMSRFPVRIAWDYDEALERNICGNVDWACRVQKARANARRAGLKVIIDPRMSQAGAGLIASGLSSDEAADVTYLANLTSEQRNIVEAN